LIIREYALTILIHFIRHSGIFTQYFSMTTAYGAASMALFDDAMLKDT